jgi:hypothetical protein
VTVTQPTEPSIAEVVESRLEYPRVLHVGHHPIGAPTNSGLTLGTMFGSWPDSELLQVCIRAHEAAPLRGEVVMTPAALAPVEFGLRAALKPFLWARRAVGANVERESDGMNNSVQRSGALSTSQRARLAVGVVNDIGPVWLTPKLRKEVKRFRPHVVHSLLGGVRAMRLSLALSRYLDVPLVPHFMDDWVDNLFTHGQLGGYARSQTELVFAQVLERAPVCLTIGEDMRREFEFRLNRPCVTVGNSVDLDDYSGAGHGQAHSRPKLVMRYVGGLHLGRDQVLSVLAEVLDRESFGDRKWTLELFVPEHDRGRAGRMAERFRSVVHGGSLAPSEVPGTLVTADALVFLESELPGITSFTRLSVSTKVPQYLASSRPLLVMGPPDQASVRTLMRSSLSVYSGSSPSPEALLASLERLTALAGKTGGAAPGQPAWLIAEFGEQATQERLRAGLARAAATPLGKAAHLALTRANR